MIRFSPWGAYLLLVPQRRVLIFETGRFFGTGAYFFFEKQPNVQNKNLIRYLSKKEQ